MARTPHEGRTQASSESWSFSGYTLPGGTDGWMKEEGTKLTGLVASREPEMQPVLHQLGGGGRGKVRNSSGATVQGEAWGGWVDRTKLLVCLNCLCFLQPQSPQVSRVVGFPITLPPPKYPHWS